MGNSTSKQQKGKRSKSKPSRKLKQHEHLRFNQRVGIGTHPYHHEHTDQYRVEYSDSASSSDEEHDHDQYLQPKGLFRDPTPNYNHNRAARSQGPDGRHSMESLTYSDSTNSLGAGPPYPNGISNSMESDHSGSTVATANLHDPKKKKKGLLKGLKRKKEKNYSGKENVPHDRGHGHGLGLALDNGASDPYLQHQHRHQHQHQHQHRQQPYHHHNQLQNKYGKAPMQWQQGHGNIISSGHDSEQSMSLLTSGRLPTIADVSYQSSSTEPEADQSNPNMTNILGDLAENDYQEEKDDEGYGSVVSRDYTAVTEEAEDLPFRRSLSGGTRSDSSRMAESENVKNVHAMLDRQHASYVEGQEPLADISMPNQNLGNLFASVNLSLNETMNNSKYQSLDQMDEEEEEELVKGEQFNETSLDRTDFVQETSMDKSEMIQDGALQISFGDSNDLTNSIDDNNSKQESSVDDGFDQFVLDRGSRSPQLSTGSSSDSEIEAETGHGRERKSNTANQSSDTRDDTANQSSDTRDVLNESSLVESGFEDLETENSAEIKEETESGLQSGEESSTINQSSDARDVTNESSLGESAYYELEKGNPEDIQDVLSDSDSSLEYEDLSGADPAEIEDILSESSFEESKVDDSLLQSNLENVQDELSASPNDESEADNLLFQDESNLDHSEEVPSIQNVSKRSDDSRNINYILNRTDSNILNRTDMAVQDESILNRTDMAILPFHSDSNLDMLDELNADEADEELSASGLLEECNSVSRTIATATRSKASIEENRVSEERKRSPFPIIDNQKAPTSSAMTNMLPSLSQDDGEDADLPDECKNASKDEENGKSVSKKADLIESKQLMQTKIVGFPFKGPEIGTVIKLVTNQSQKKVEGKEAVDSSLSKTPPGAIATKMAGRGKKAFTTQVTSNAAFLFSEESRRQSRQIPNNSKVDEERLSLLKSQELSRRNSSFAHIDIVADDSLATIQQKLEQMKVENRRLSIANSSRRSSVSVYRTAGEIRIRGEMLEKPMKSSVYSSSNTTVVKSEWAGAQLKRPSDAEVAEGSQVELKHSKLDAHLSTNQEIAPKALDVNSQSETTSSGSLNFDDVSITELQKKNSAITPLKTKSPYIRFKKAQRLFGAHHEAKDTGNKQPRKSPPRKNASAAKEDFIFAQVTSIDGRLRQNNQRSSKKKRRLTSGEDVIAPRRPKLVDPLFNRSSVPIEYDEEADDPLVFDLDSLDSPYADGENTGSRAQEECPYDESDELTIPTPSSDKQSSMSNNSMDEISALMKSASVESPNLSIDSPNSPNAEQRPLRSAMKKSIGKRNANNRVSWFAADEIQNSPIPNQSHSNGLVHSPSNDSVEIMSPPRSFSQRMNEAIDSNDQQSKIHNKSPSRIQKIHIYSPTTASVESRSPQKNLLSSANGPLESFAKGQSTAIGKENDTSSVQESLISLSPLRNFSPQKTMLSERNGPVNPFMTKAHSPLREKENDNSSIQESLTSLSPQQTFSESSSVSVFQRGNPQNSSVLNLSPGPGRRTPSQNRKWTNTPTKSWRELKAEHDAKKQSSKKKRKKRRVALRESKQNVVIGT